MFLPAVHLNWPTQFWQASVVQVGRIRKLPDIVCVLSFAGYFTLILFLQNPHYSVHYLQPLSFLWKVNMSTFKCPIMGIFHFICVAFCSEIGNAFVSLQSATNLMKIILDFDHPHRCEQTNKQNKPRKATFCVSLATSKCLTPITLIYQTKSVPTKMVKKNIQKHYYDTVWCSFLLLCMPFSPPGITDCQKKEKKKRLAWFPNSPEIWALYEDMAITYHHQKVLVLW